jgi:hypothetical protein
MAEQLIVEVQKRMNSEAVILREQIDQALAYMDGVENPNVHTLSHIRRLLTGEQTFRPRDIASDVGLYNGEHSPGCPPIKHRH